jgi:hypothetical protein
VLNDPAIITEALLLAGLGGAAGLALTFRRTPLNAPVLWERDSARSNR